MLINLSNHPSAKWSPEQLAAANVYGKVVDLPFPVVNPDGAEDHIRALCDEYLRKIDDICRDEACPVSEITVHIMGEMTLTFSIIEALQRRGILCVASTTERIVSEVNGVRTSEFRFKQFRKYLTG
jgi:hypothetical protein